MLNIREDNIEFVQAPTAINDGFVELSAAAVSGDTNLTADEKSLLQAGFCSDDSYDIEIYYVPIVKRGGVYPSGVAFPSDWYQNMGTGNLNDSVIITDHADLYTLTHELYHIFKQESGSAHETAKTNVMYSGGSTRVNFSACTPTDPRRFTTDQGSVIRSSGYVTNCRL